MANCKTCGKPVIETPSGIVHEGGGITEQICTNPSCGWTGSQIGGFTNCPRCGSGVNLKNGHSAN